MSYRSGNDGYVEVGVTRLNVTSWESTETGDLAETTNTGSGGYKESIPVKRSMAGTVNADFDPVLGPKAAPLLDVGTPVALTLHTDGAGSYTIAIAQITQINFTQAAIDKVSYSFTWESSGAFNYA